MTKRLDLEGLLALTKEQQVAALADTNAQLEALSAQERVAWALEHLPGEFVLSSSFGIQAALMLHLVSQQKRDIPVILTDTGYLFPETYQFIDQLTERLRLNLKVYRADLSPAWQEARYGKLWELGVEGIERYNQLNKVEPMARALQGDDTLRDPVATLADGVRVKEPGHITRAVLKELLDDVVIVREAELRETLVRLALEEHLIAEGAGALALAAGKRIAAKRKCAVVSGGNVDAGVLAKLLSEVRPRAPRKPRQRAQERLSPPQPVSSPCEAGGGREGVLFARRSKAPLPNPPLRFAKGREQSDARTHILETIPA